MSLHIEKQKSGNNEYLQPKLEELRASEAAVDFTEMIEKAIENTELMVVK